MLNHVYYMPVPSGFSPDLGDTLVHLAQTFIALGEEIAAEGRLTPQLWAVLHQVGQAGAAGVSPSEIATASGTSRANVTKLVGGLARRGLVRVRASPTDGRQKRLTATASGGQVLARLNARKAAQLAAALDGLGAEERQALHRVGTRLLARLGPRRLAGP